MERTGSIKNKRVAVDLQEERNLCNFNMQEMTELLYDSKEFVELYHSYSRDFENDPILRSTEKFYDMTREEQIEI